VIGHVIPVVPTRDDSSNVIAGKKRGRMNYRHSVPHMDGFQGGYYGPLGNPKKHRWEAMMMTCQKKATSINGIY
jgi:hypothetical protein